MPQEIDILEYLENRSDDDILIDLREELTFRCGSLPGSMNIPIDRIQELYQLPTDKNIYLFCQAGEISAEMAELLTDNGCRAFNLGGGYRKYLRSRIKEEKLDV